MKNLLVKEFRLALPPATILFLLMAAMVVIPEYPTFVSFFYTCMGVFFICLTGRENNDIPYTLQLPVRKRDIVKARMWMSAMVEIASILVASAFLPIAPPSGIGMDANIAFLGMVLVFYAVFNLVFFTMHYKNVKKVGIPFLLGSFAFFAAAGAATAGAFAVPFVRDYLDTPDPRYIEYKVAVLLAGMGIFVLLNTLAFKISANSFDKQDLN